MPQLGSENNPMRVAIVGSGPSGFYAAEALIKSDIVVEIDMLERLPSPYGLVRSGVAPDHPKLKQAILLYDKIAQSPEFNLIIVNSVVSQIVSPSVLSPVFIMMMKCYISILMSVLIAVPVFLSALYKRSLRMMIFLKTSKNGSPSMQKKHLISLFVMSRWIHYPVLKNVKRNLVFNASFKKSLIFIT